MILPNFLIIGTAKSGTTTLRNSLNQHPKIGLLGETNFFAADDAFFADNLNWYQTRFNQYQSKKIVGEKSWRYSCKETYPKARERIIQTLGKEIQLVYIVRHPFKRLESLWIEFVTGGLQYYATDSFTESLRLNPIFLDSSRYWTNISWYMEIFSPERIKILFFEDLIAQPQATYNEIFNFLNIHPIKIENTATAHNISQGKLAETQTTRYLRQIPGTASLRKKLPTSVRSLLKKTFKSKVIQRPTWDSVTLNYFQQELDEEIEKILSFCGKPRDFWSFDLDEYKV